MSVVHSMEWTLKAVRVLVRRRGGRAGRGARLIEPLPAVGLVHPSMWEDPWAELFRQRGTVDPGRPELRAPKPDVLDEAGSKVTADRAGNSRTAKVETLLSSSCDLQPAGCHAVNLLRAFHLLSLPRFQTRLVIW